MLLLQLLLLLLLLHPRFYLSNDPVANAAPLAIIEKFEYPFCPLEQVRLLLLILLLLLLLLLLPSQRVSVLQYLTHSVLSAQSVRDDLAAEGALPMEDHCR